MEPIQKITPLAGPIDAVTSPPGSKSITNRALLLAALAVGESTLQGALDSEDTRVMAKALTTLGVPVTRDGDLFRVEGKGGFPVKKAEVDVANSGTTARFLTAALGWAQGNYRIDGKERMRARPIGDLLHALQKLGVDVRAEAGNDCPPILIRPAKTFAAGMDVDRDQREWQTTDEGRGENRERRLAAGMDVDRDQRERQPTGEGRGENRERSLAAGEKTSYRDQRERQTTGEGHGENRERRLAAEEKTSYRDQRERQTTDEGRGENRERRLAAAAAAEEVSIAGNVSSQFFSALLMATPMAKRDIQLNIVGELVSRPYVIMTTAIMASFGVKVEENVAGNSFYISADSSYTARTYRIEPDASAASYFFAISAILGGKMTVRGLSKKSLQGDVGFVDCLAAMGCRASWGEDEISVQREVKADGSLAPLLGIDVDMNAVSDTAQTLAVVALFAETPTRIRNIAHVRGKETDRISAVVTELRKFGIRVDEFDDGLQIWPDPSILTASQIKRIATYDDHRMAMSFSLAGLKIPGVEIENPACVAKTYPGFYEDLARVMSRK